MQILCLYCGNPFEAKRATGRYCSARCKKRFQRGSVGGVVTPLQRPVPDPPAPPSPSAPSTPEARFVREPGKVTAAALRELTAAGREETLLAQAVLAIALRIDSAETSGSALAALSRELRSTMAEAVADAPRAADPLDEIGARRTAKAAGA